MSAGTRSMCAMDRGLLAGIEPGEYVYFTHSYKAPVTLTPLPSRATLSVASAVERGNVMGVQFHPENPARPD